MLLIILMVKKLLKYFTKQNDKKHQEVFRIEKVIKRKDDKLYFKWEGYDNLLNS